MTIAWQTLHIPLSSGLDGDKDARAKQPPALDIARDVQFDEHGGIQTRLPFTAFNNQIFGGGTLSNCRRLAVVNDEICVFTDTALYSWNEQLDSWVLRSTHLAVDISERPTLVTTGDQIEPDRAELNGTIVYVWVEGLTVYGAAIDSATKSLLAGPTIITPVTAFSGRPRVVALTTKILLFMDDGAGNLTVRAIDPATPATGFASAPTNVLAAAFFGKYDVVRIGATDQCFGGCNRNPTTSYTVFTVTAGLVVATSTKARTCDGPIAVACTTTQTQIIRGNGTNIQGDLLTTSTFADVFTAQAIGTVAGTPVNQIAIEYASATSAHVFWAAQETAAAGSTSFGTKTNTVTTANVIGTQSTMVLRCGVASRAFARGGRVFVWLVFASDSTSFGTGSPLGIRAQLQNTFFLYRDDGLLISKAVFDTAGGFAPSAGNLPGVVGSGNNFAWCGSFRRVIDLGGNDHTGYAARSPNDITFSFDDNEARRTARIGRTLYISGGIVMQYDSLALSEVGFLVYPWAFAVQDPGVAGNIAAGTYSWKSTLKFVNGQHELERSTTATGEQITFGASRFAIITIFNLFVTLKTVRPPSIEIWRAPAGATEDSPYYLATGQDPDVVTGDNCYVANDHTNVGPVWNDNLSEANLIKRETNPENGNVLESLAPPGAKIIIASDTRVFLGDVSGDEDTVWYSRLRGEGEIASFHDSLRIPVPRNGGRITALALNNETLTVFRESAIYALPGDGFDNLGQGSNYGPARVISLDVGAVSQETVAFTPLGTVFKSSKGWYILTPGWGLQYIGGPVAAFNSDTVHAVDVVESQHQVRILTGSRMLVWDYAAATQESPSGQWAEWTISDGVHALMWNGSHVYLTATGPKIQSTAYSGLTYGQDAETPWIKPADQQGDIMLRWFSILGEYRSAHLVRVRVARDYQYASPGVPSYFDDSVWSPSPTTVGSVLQVKHPPTRTRCQAFKVRLTAVTESVRATLVTTALSPQVATSGAVWTSTWSAVSTLPGEMGNRVTMSIAFESGATQVIDVRDHFAYVSGRWTEDENNIGVRIVGVVATPPTVAAIEAAIAHVTTGTKLATLTTPDVTPAKTLNVSSMAGQSAVGSFTSGAYGSPTGEALKLTGLAAEIGVQRGIKRLPVSQKVA